MIVEVTSESSQSTQQAARRHSNGIRGWLRRMRARMPSALFECRAIEIERPWLFPAFVPFSVLARIQITALLPPWLTITLARASWPQGEFVFGTLRDRTRTAGMPLIAPGC
jgi:hypothetical protein